MCGGDIETDYDVICRCPDRVSVIERYGRHMMVLCDSEEAACFVPWRAGHILIVQGLVGDPDIEELLARITASAPCETLRFDQIDSALRLLVGVYSGDGKNYGFSEVECARGVKAVSTYYFNDLTAHLV